jgi:hypothetical protein
VVTIKIKEKLTKLTAQDRHTAEVYFQQVYQRNERIREAVTNYVGPAPIVRGNWNVTDSVINQPLRRGSWNVTLSNRQANDADQNILPINNPEVQPAPSETVVNSDNSLHPEDDAGANQAKRRKILLEMQLERNKMQECNKESWTTSYAINKEKKKISSIKYAEKND